MSEFGRFLLAGGTAAAANYLSRILFGLWMSFAASIVAAYLVGMVTAYLLFRYCVFPTSDQPPKIKKQLSWFILINIFSAVQILIISILLEKYCLQFVSDLLLRQEMAHFVGITIPMIASYFGHKYLTYR